MNPGLPNAAREQAVTDEVVASFARDDRLSDVLRSLVRHLHAFARDVRLTQEEWAAAISSSGLVVPSASSAARLGKVTS